MLWRAALLLMAATVCLPVFVILASLLLPFSDIWQHLLQTVMQDYVTNSFLLLIGVGIGTLSMGVTCAWLTSMCSFPGRRFFEWALLLPMAMPAYIIAYTYTGLLDFAGPVQTALRLSFGWAYGDYWFPEIRSLPGAVCMLSLVLYPYVYLLTRSAFLQQSVAVLEVSRSLGNGPWQSFITVAIPLARPAIVAGMSLALMETLADYGTVQYFGVSTFTTGIFRTWFGLGELRAAVQLSSLLLIFVFSIVILERWSRQRMKFHNVNPAYKHLSRVQIRGFKGLVCFLLCFTPLFCGFILPFTQLSFWTITNYENSINRTFLELMLNSFTLAACAALVALLVALFMCYTKRVLGDAISNSSVQVATMGYAIPGTVIAVGVLMPFAWFDKQLDNWLRDNFDISSGLILSGTLVALTFAYVVRFLSVSIQSVESGLGKIHYSMDESARSLGYRPLEALRTIHIPMLRASLLTAFLLVFVDVLKELPTTLILRPFNFNTLAVRAYELASDERLADASTSAIAIVIIGLLPVMLLTKTMNREAQA